MSDPFRSAHLKIDRAKHHVEELNGRILRFQSEHPHEIIIEADPEPGYKVYKFRLTEPVPFADFSVLIGDALGNMRAALDHATYACAVINKSPSFRTCNFPFGKDAAAFNRAVKRCSSVPNDIQTLLGTFQAHKDGNVMLWRMNKMCNGDKHASITPVLIGWENLQILVREGSIESPRNPFWNDAKAEIELFRTKTDPQYDLHISLAIALNSPEAIAPNRAQALLTGFVLGVEDIVSRIEAETRRLFPGAF